MRWRRGFFRIWVLLSILWLIVVGVFAYQPIVDPYVRERVFFYSFTDKPGPWVKYAAKAELNRRNGIDPELQPVSFETYSDGYRMLEDGRASGDLQVVNAKSEPNFTLYVSKGTGKDEISRQLDEVLPIAKELKQRSISRSRLEAIQATLASALIPPIALLGIGWAAAWAISGFRSS
ncbi:hypothetical protein ABMA32_03530 [Mesorhizobium sp. VNQ89]|uniref:hypothetical protein n=1 Tax=Mesorhizobium quangtriensis TaxID=3157709 RepID=UPI0032B71924